MAYIGVSPSNGVRRVHTYTATASQTTFSGAGAEGTSLSYKDSNFVDVYQNGIKLGDADYTSTSGTSIVLAQGASVDDLVVVVVFDVFSVADTVSKADGGTFDGNVTMGGTLAVTGETTLSTHLNMGDNDKIKLGASGDLEIFHDGSKSVISDEGTGVLWIAGDSEVSIGNPAVTEYYIRAFKDGAVQLMHDNSTKFATTSTGVDVNSSADATMSITAGGTSDDSKIDFIHGSTTDGGITYDHNGSYASEQMQFRTGNNTTNMRLDGAANLIIGNDTIDQSALSSGTGITLLGATGQILQAVSASSINYVNITNYSSGTRNFFVFTDDGSTKGTISYNGSNTAYNTSSDYRLKENFVTNFDATSRLKQLKPTRFNFIGSDLTQDGFLAHEVSNIVPEAITGEKDAMQVETRYTADDKETQGDNPTKKVGDAKTYSKTKIDPQGIDQSKLVPLLVKTIQELEARITALENAE